MKFTQFLRPHGKRRQIYIARPPDVENDAAWLESQGCQFEIEELMSGEVSMAVEWVKPKVHPCGDEAGAVWIEICLNGPDVPAHVDRMIKKAVRILKKRS
jgi:hypothetical protein